MKKINEIVDTLHKTPNDINEHMPTLVKYSKECDHITEMGVRGIGSTWAFLAGQPKRLVSYDQHDPIKFGGDISKVYDLAAENNIQFLTLLRAMF